MKLSVIVPTLEGRVPGSLRDQVTGCDDVELVVVTGVAPVGKARNEGLRRATGDYVAWVDSDDEVTADWLAEILAALADGPDAVTFDAELVGWKGRTDCVWGVSARQATAERLRLDVYRDIRRPSWLPIYVTKRTLWTAGGAGPAGRGEDSASPVFDETVRVAEDYLILPRVLSGAKNCRYVPKKLYRYIRSATSVSNTQSAAGTVAQIDCWERRLAECPARYRGACRWGLSVSAYWVCALQTMAAPPPDAQSRANAERCRRIVRRALPALAREALASRSMPLGDRVSWMVRFASAATNVWWLQKLRHGRCRA